MHYDDAARARADERYRTYVERAMATGELHPLREPAPRPRSAAERAQERSAARWAGSAMAIAVIGLALWPLGMAAVVAALVAIKRGAGGLAATAAAAGAIETMLTLVLVIMSLQTHSYV